MHTFIAAFLLCSAALGAEIHLDNDDPVVDRVYTTVRVTHTDTSIGHDKNDVKKHWAACDAAVKAWNAKPEYKGCEYPSAIPNFTYAKKNPNTGEEELTGVRVIYVTRIRCDRVDENAKVDRESTTKTKTSNDSGRSGSTKGKHVQAK